MTSCWISGPASSSWKTSCVIELVIPSYSIMRCDLVAVVAFDWRFVDVAAVLGAPNFIPFAEEAKLG